MMTSRINPLLILFTVVVYIFLMGPLIIVLGASVSDTTYLTFPPQGLTLRWFENIFEISAFRRTIITSLATRLPGDGPGAAGRHPGSLCAQPLPGRAAGLAVDGVRAADPGARDRASASRC
jgi:hypothetical protein